jgi:molybdopterin-guanine dinucleotide biosynthesis protein A
MIDRNHLTAIILAGGKSSRMGTDKGLMDFRGKKMIEHVLCVAGAIATEILISSSNAGYSQFGFPVYEDIYKNFGPLGGIHSGLSSSHSQWNLVVSCDLPFISREFLLFLLSQDADGNAIVPVHDKMPEPLCALYNKSALPEIESLILNGELKMKHALQKLNTVYVDVPKEKFNAAVLFKNLNSPEDIAIAHLCTS